MWSLSSARNKIIHSFSTQFEKFLAKANVPAGTFHDLRKTAITNWFRQGLSEYDVMTLAGHANFQTTHRFYLAVADDLILRARRAVTHEVRPELIEKCRRRHPCPTR
jgi:integrase